MKNFKVVSVGNGGMQALNHIIASGLTGAEFIACSTDNMTLQMSKAEKKILLGKTIIRYALDGDSIERSEQGAMESREDVIDALRGADAVIIVAGLGGFDGSGASPVIVECAREVGALTVAVVTRPYIFEGPRRISRAEVALKKLSARVDTVIKIRNDNLLRVVAPNTPMYAAFKIADEILCHTVRSLLAIFQNPFRIKINAA